MADKTDDLDLDALRIGDMILFKDVARGLYLGVEGILLEDLVATDGFNLQDSLFCVHLQRQYSASRDLNAFLENYGMNIKNIEDEGAKKYLIALQRGLENEKMLNDNYMQKKHGQKVLFGDIIQLFHVKSGKYLTIAPAQLAKTERENIHVLLDTGGNAFSWIQICPRFKIDKDGDRVLNNADMYLRVAERANEFVHTADRNPLPGHHREVNCALETTSWRLMRYQSSLDSLDRSILLASQLVTIADPETRSNLTIARQTLESLDNHVVLDKPQHIPSSGDMTAMLADNRSASSVGGGDDGSTSARSHASSEREEVEYAHEFGDIILEPMPPQDVVDSNHLWFLESSSLYVGGPIKWKSDLVRFRHLNTSQYLMQTARTSTEEETLEEVEEIIFTTTPNPYKEGTLFSLTELSSTGTFLSNGKATQIGRAGNYIERGEALEDSVFVFHVKGTREKVDALSLMIHRCTGSSSSADAVEDELPDGMSSHEPLDVLSGLAVRNYLRKYHDMTVVPRTDSVGTIWPSALRSDLDFFKIVVDKTVFFSQGFPISAVGIQLGIDKAETAIRRQRQKLLREQDTLEVVLRIINKLIPLTEKLDRMRRTTVHKNKKKNPTYSVEEEQVVAMGQQVLSKCFSILYYSILDNQENQMYVADFMPILLNHLNAQPLAGKCVTEMLSKNMELQETKIGTREIQIFVDKLRSSKMNAMYLQLLQACCSCEGDGVDNNQCKVANMLFANTNDIIISLHADPKRSTEVKWEQPSLYIPPAPIPGSPLRGVELLQSLPQLSLSWTTNSIEFSTLGLFGKLSVNVQDLYRKKAFDAIEAGHGDRDKNKNVKSKKKNSAEQKEAVANYFIAEMFLGAEMCMDRNYVAMHKLDELFTYEKLITIIKLDVNNNLKCAAVRLLMCLHVDRDPQAASKIPLLTRMWTDIKDVKNHDDPKLPYVDPGRRYMFGLIQQMISEHVQGMANNRWDELSRHMLEMLRTLAQFNFYGTNERMKDVIGPLIRALDRRQLPAIEVEAPTMTRSTRKIQDEAQKALNGGLAKDSDDTKEEDKYETENLDSLEERVSGSGEPWYKRVVCGCLSFLQKVATFPFHRGAKVLAMEDDEESGVMKIEGFRTPLRFSKAPIYELETMVEAVDILAFAQSIFEDRNVSLFLGAFHKWENTTDAEKRNPPDIFNEVVDASKVLSLGIADFDNVMLDVLMFVHMPLVQSTLEVLMAHHSLRRTLLENASNVQLLASSHRERQFKMIDQMLQQLEQNAEMHELWGVLETEQDRQTNISAKNMLDQLIDFCRVRRDVLEFDEDYTADTAIQDLYRNLGCFEICMKVMGLLDSVEEDEDGELDEAGLNTKDLCLRCNTLLYWFFLNNPKNQELGFKELDFFLETLGGGINSHLTIKAIFKNNEALMRAVPHATLGDLVDKISREGRSHHYLSLFASISHVGEKNLADNQFQIVMTLTAPGRLQKVACFLCPIDHPDYELKRELMQEVANETRDLSLDDLPPLLAYHLMLLEVLSGCTVGRLNITTVEAKVQSVYSNVDLVASIMDPDTILIAKIIMSKYLFNAVIEVELEIPGLERAPHIWRLLDSYQQVLQTAKEEIVRVQQLGWESPDVSRQRIEYIIICIMIIGAFFGSYYDSSTFRGSDPVKSSDKARYTKSDASKLIVAFFHKIKEIYDLDSPVLSEDMKVMMNTTLESLKKHASKYIHVSIAPRLQRSASIRGGTASPAKPSTPAGGARATSAGGATAPATPGTAASSAPNGEDSPSKRRTPAGKKSQDAAERKLIVKYQNFVSEIANDSTVQQSINNENVVFINLLERLPYISDPVESDVRYETLIRKLVSHIRENITIVNGQKRLDARVTKTSTWIMKAFRAMIENKMGMSIDERDDEGGAEEDERAAPVVNALNNCGATALCLDLIADGIDETLQMEAVRLGVGLLFKEGGALEVQAFMNNHLLKTQSDLFFKQVRLTLQKLMAWHNWNGIITLEVGEEPKPPDELLILRFLQLMCEGHYLPNQDIMREQPTNAVSYNLLDDFVAYFNCLSRLPCRTSTVAAIRLTATILEVIQGPCEGNQAHFALNTELVESLNRINRGKLINDCEEEEEIELKKTSIDIFQGLLEGQGENSVVYDRVLSVIHLDIILMMSKRQTLTDVTPDKPSEEQEILQTECVVLLQMLCNYKPALYDELGVSRNIEDIVGSGTAMIEVIWRGDIHRRFFHVPAMCSFLAKASKDSLVENVDRSNSENKLIDFLNRSHDLYREAKHQQRLTEAGVSGIFSRKNQNIATWITFILAVFINMLFVAVYGMRDGVQTVPQRDDLIAQYVNLIQVFVASFTLLLWVVVKSPVVYQSMEEQGHSMTDCIIATATEPLTVYYVVYLVVSILGVVDGNYYCSLLLLDIVVKNSTTRDVLNAVVTPWKQLMMASLLELFVVYIYSFFIFYFFRYDTESEVCYTLFSCFKFALSYGFLCGGGVGDTFIHAQGQRLILDFLFFSVVLVILLNVIFGIIIDTFSSMRVDKLERVKDTNEVCFICGINKQVFDRASDEPEGFKTHIKVDHNMWNYLYFIFMLWEQDKDDDDGLEQYVRRAIDANEIMWFPLRKAMRLDQVVSPAELLRGDLKESIRTTQSNLVEKFDEFQTDVNGMFEQLLISLRNEGSSGQPRGLHTADAPPRTAGGINDDENSIESLQVGDNVDRSPGKHVSVGIVALEGVSMEQGDLRTVSCRFIYDNGMTDFRCTDVDNGTVVFDAKKMVPMFDNVNLSDRRSCSIQVLYGHGVLKFLAVLEVPVLDLLHPLGESYFVLEKSFERPEQSTPCTLKIAVKNVVATSFGRDLQDRASHGEAEY